MRRIRRGQNGRDLLTGRRGGEVRRSQQALRVNQLITVKIRILDAEPRIPAAARLGRLHRDRDGLHIDDLPLRLLLSLYTHPGVADDAVDFGDKLLV